MRLNLQDLAKKNENTQLFVAISDRIPPHLDGNCTVAANFKVKNVDDYFLMDLQTEAELNIICQRCSQSFQIPYNNTTQLAICNNDDRAETLVAYYECVVSNNDLLDIETVIIDEMYLYAPQYHPNIDDCDKSIEKFMTPRGIK